MKIATKRPPRSQRTKNWKRAECHPDRPVEGHGLCSSCLAIKWRKEHPKWTANYNKERYRKRPEHYRALSRKYARTHESRRMARRYGITIEEYETLYNDHNGCCAICGKGNGKHKLLIDHDHDTGKVRGLLCKKCNTAIGMLHESEALMNKAISYLRKWKAHDPSHV